MSPRRAREPLESELSELLAVVRHELGRNPRAAVAAAEAAVAIARGLGFTARAQALHALGRARLVRREPRLALRALRRAARIYRKQGDRAALASLRLVEIAAHALADAPERALDAARDARRLYRSVGDALGLAKVEVNLGNLYHRLDRPRLAIPPLTRARQTFARLGQHLDSAMAALNLANALSLCANLDLALQLYDEAHAELLGLGHQAQAALVDYNRAYLFYLRGDYDRALRGLTRTAAAFDALADPTHAGLCHLDRAEVLIEIGLNLEAEHEATLARDVFVTHGLRYEAARALLFHAMARRGQGRISGIEAELTQARREFRAAKNLNWAAIADVERARLALTSRPARARTLALAAIGTLEQARLPLRAARAIETAARAASALGDHDRARRELSSGARVARRRGARMSEAHLSLALAEELCSAGEPTRALVSFDLAIDRLEALHRAAPDGEGEATLAADRARAYHGAVDACLTLADRGREDAGLLAFQYAERARARSFIDRALARELGRGNAPRARREQLDRWSDLGKSARWRRHVIERGAGDGSRSLARDRARQLVREAEAIEREVAAIEAELATDLEHAGLDIALLADPRAVLAGLAPDSAVISYFVGAKRTAAFVVDGEGFRVVPLETTRQELRSALRNLQFQMNRFALGDDFVGRQGSAMTRAAREPLAHLGACLFAPIADSCRAKRLVIVPHDLLHYVPFHALEHGGQPLIEARHVTVAPSVSALHRCLARRPRTTAHGSLILGLPTANTPAIEDEVRAVAGVLPEPRVLLGAEATWTNLRDLAGQRRFLHVSTHGLYRSDDPMASAVRLADRWLTFREIRELRLEAELTVLSACHAGLDRILSGDEQLGLGRALLEAGSAAVVTTLWAVQDRAIAEWMTDFYTHALPERDTAAAFRQATLAARERRPHPYYWAPCVLSGRPYLTMGLADLEV